jgi:hypothetical protein
MNQTSALVAGWGKLHFMSAKLHTCNLQPNLGPFLGLFIGEKPIFTKKKIRPSAVCQILLLSGQKKILSCLQYGHGYGFKQGQR